MIYQVQAFINQHVSVPSIMALTFATRVARAVSTDAFVAAAVLPDVLEAVRVIVGMAASAKMALTYQNSFVLQKSFLDTLLSDT